MSENEVIVVRKQGYLEAVEWMVGVLKGAGLSVIRTLELRSAQQEKYTCQEVVDQYQIKDFEVVVLMVYAENQDPITIIAQGYQGQTWFSLVDTPQQKVDPKVEASLRSLLMPPAFSQRSKNSTIFRRRMKMTDHTKNALDNSKTADEQEVSVIQHPKGKLALQAFFLLAVFIFGAGSGYLFGSRVNHAEDTMNTTAKQNEAMAMMQEINPSEGYTIPAMFGSIGPQLVAAGAIDLVKFSALYQQQNKPLTDAQMTILTKEEDTRIVINPDNANFLLNLLWAFGLTNQNAILTEGLMVTSGSGNVGGFASTGGWTLGTKAPTDLYSSMKMVELTPDQQARLLEVAAGVFRPCCNNPTHFPDCNHGMAMLGLLELMASQGATADAMFEAAKYVTAFWHPQQMLELATAFKVAKNVDFKEADARTIVSSQFASISGFQSVHQWLSQNGLLEQAPSSGGSCGVQ